MITLEGTLVLLLIQRDQAVIELSRRAAHRICRA